MKTIILAFLVLSVIIATVVADGSECQTGDTKKEACNTCRCANGIWACSRKFCPPRTRRAADCQPGDTKKEDCNTCRCTNGLWSCDKKLCIPRNKRGTACTPETTFKKDCNTCVCNAQGTNAACTLRACI